MLDRCSAADLGFVTNSNCRRGKTSRRYDDHNQPTKSEQRLLLRCTALEQERSGLADRLAASQAAVTQEAAAAGQLKQRLAELLAERDEVVRCNTTLQVGLPEAGSVCLLGLAAHQLPCTIAA